MDKPDIHEVCFSIALLVIVVGTVGVMIAGIYWHYAGMHCGH